MRTAESFGIGRDDDVQVLRYLSSNARYRFGNRSKVGNPSGIMWKSCLSMV